MARSPAPTARSTSPCSSTPPRIEVASPRGARQLHVHAAAGAELGERELPVLAAAGRAGDAGEACAHARGVDLVGDAPPQPLARGQAGEAAAPDLRLRFAAIGVARQGLLEPGGVVDVLRGVQGEVADL